MDYQALLNEVYKEVESLNLSGKVANYIPELKNVDPNAFGISLITPEKEIFTIGDTEQKFSIQSISKALTLAMAYPVLNEDLWTRVGVEPSGNPFNSLSQIEYEDGIPRNPFINAGALVITDILMERYKDPISGILTFIKEITGLDNIKINEKTALSELKHSHRNKALAHLMKSFNNLNNDIDKLIEVYCKQCAIEMTTTELAMAFLLFTKHGCMPNCENGYLNRSQTKRINAVMQTCGLYDEAGEFTFKVGLPAKSGVGGGIAAVLPNKFSVVTWSPQLNKKGNSVKGMKALELLTTKLGYSIF